MDDQRPNWNRSVPRGQSWGGCRVCRHFQLDMTCSAFPQRIPIEIASGEIDHLVVRPGQVGDAVFEVTPRPIGLSLRLLRAAAICGEPWAVDAFAKAQESTRR